MPKSLWLRKSWVTSMDRQYTCSSILLQLCAQCAIMLLCELPTIFPDKCIFFHYYTLLAQHSIQWSTPIVAYSGMRCNIAFIIKVQSQCPVYQNWVYILPTYNQVQIQSTLGTQCPMLTQALDLKHSPQLFFFEVSCIPVGIKSQIETHLTKTAVSP